MPTFNEIQQEIVEMLSLPDDELTDGQRTAMDAYLEELADMEASKVDAFGQFLKVQSSIAEACKKEAQRLAAKAKAAENRIAGIKEHYLHIMQQRDLKKVSGSAYTLTVRESEGVTVTALVETIPDIFLRKTVKIEPDKAVIREALKGGIEIDGCSLQKSYSLQVA